MHDSIARVKNVILSVTSQPIYKQYNGAVIILDWGNYLAILNKKNISMC